MRVMIDTNVIISAMLKEGSLPDIILNEVCINNDLILCSYIINECYDVAKRRFPAKIQVLENLFANLHYELAAVPENSQVIMRDIKDQPILNTAIEHRVDVLITGDQHFLELTIDFPRICNPSEYKRLYIDNETLQN